MIAISVLAIASSVLSSSATVSYTGSDPRGTLLTTQALIEHGTFALDAYPDIPVDHRIVGHGGRTFYAFPPGTPLLSVPAVAIARLAGLDMARTEDDDRLQRVLSAVSIAAVATLASLLALRWFSWPVAITLAGIFVLGTPVMSTMGTALWSTNATVVLTLCALLLLSRFGPSPGAPVRAATIGVLLGAAFWCRPPAFLIAALVVLWMVARAATAPAAGRHSATVSAVALFAAVVASPALLVLLSRLMYGTWLPEYYAVARVSQSHRFWTALTAHLISPSRGLLIFAPATTLAVVVLIFWPRRVFRFPLAALGLGWVCLHLAIVSRFPHWWGGYSYGSRLMVDALPGVFLLWCAAAAVVRDRSSGWQVLGLAVLVPAGAIGIWINSVEGLFNPATEAWNASPDIDRFPGYAFDWSTPQFLATSASLDARLDRHVQWLRAPLQPGVTYTPASTNLVFGGWSLEKAGSSEARRSSETIPSVRFLVSEETLRGADRVMLTLALGSAGAADGEVWLNGKPLARLRVTGAGPDFYVIGIPRKRIRSLDYDVLEWNEAEWHASPDVAPVPIRLWGLRLHAVGRGDS